MINTGCQIIIRNNNNLLLNTLLLSISVNSNLRKTRQGKYSNPLTILLRQNKTNRLIRYVLQLFDHLLSQKELNPIVITIKVF